MTFKAKLSDLIKHSRTVYIDGLTLCNFSRGGYDYQFDARIDLSDNDPEFPEYIYVMFDQEVELNDQGVGTIRIQDQEADEPEEDEAHGPTKEAIIECLVQRPMIESDIPA